MHFTPGFFDLVQRQGGLLVAQIVSRDNLHLSPPGLTRAAAKRLRAGLRALEAYLRRVLLALALNLEPDLKPSGQLYNPRPSLRASKAERSGFSVFTAGRDWAGIEPSQSPVFEDALTPNASIPAAPLLARLSALKALLEAPDARARRLAFHLARHRPGPVMPPGTGQIGVPRRYGTEASAIYHAMAQAIFTAGRARPPPLDPVPRPGPRIRCL